MPSAKFLTESCCKDFLFRMTQQAEWEGRPASVRASPVVFELGWFVLI